MSQCASGMSQCASGMSPCVAGYLENSLTFVVCLSGSKSDTVCFPSLTLTIDSMYSSKHSEHPTAAQHRCTVPAMHLVPLVDPAHEVPSACCGGLSAQSGFRECLGSMVWRWR